MLRGAPVVDVADLVHAADGAVGGTGFLGEELALDDLGGVLRDGDAGIAALLGAVADDAVLIEIEIPRAGAATPVVGLAVGDGFLKVVEARIAAAGEFAYFVPDAALFFAKRL